jgi:thioredoxin-like negative regulator of GroEL
VPLSPEIAAAQQTAQAQPGDPAAQLALSLAYWDAGMKRSALETLNAAANLAARDRAFLLRASSEFTSRQAWLPAAAMNMRLVRTVPVDQPLPAELTDALHESIYKAVADKEFTLYLSFAEIERMDQPLGLVAQGRYHLLNNNLADARLSLNQVRTLKPGFPESVLLDAEIKAREGRIDEARQLLTVTASDLGNADWLINFANELLKGLPQ